MALQIHHSVARGELDNRIKGHVRGRLWIQGRPDPVQLDLTGNPHPDIAGCSIKFVNPLPISIEDPYTLAELQQGALGEFTASARVRISAPQLQSQSTANPGTTKPKEVLANRLYLEWFSPTNGRIVFKTTDCQITVSTPEWQMTDADKQQRALDASTAMKDFLQSFTQAFELQQRLQKRPQAEWDEQDYEVFLRGSEARAQRFLEIMEKYGDSEELKQTIHHDMDMDMGWAPPDVNISGFLTAPIDKILGQASTPRLPSQPPATSDLNVQDKGIEGIANPKGEFVHPLYQRCSQLDSTLHDQIVTFEFLASRDPDLSRLLSELNSASVRLACALNSNSRPEHTLSAPMRIAYLNRALQHLVKAEEHLESAATRQLLTPIQANQSRKDLIEIRQGIVQIVQKERGV